MKWWTSPELSFGLSALDTMLGVQSARQQSSEAIAAAQMAGRMERMQLRHQARLDASQRHRQLSQVRSEERRVGKACRARGATCRWQEPGGAASEAVAQ